MTTPTPTQPSSQPSILLDAPPPYIEWIQTVELGYDFGNNTTGFSFATNSNNANHQPPDGMICFNCGASHSKLLKCARCQVASYCQKECQVNDWKNGGHKLACDSYKRVGPHMTSMTNDKRKQDEARNLVFGRIRLYACAYAVHKSRTLGRGFLFVQSNHSLAIMSLTKPQDSYGRPILHPPRSVLLHFLTLGEYDSEVCQEDFEMALVRTKLHEAVETYNEEQHVVVLMRFRCGNLSLGIAPLAPDYGVCKKLGLDYFANDSTAGSLQLNLDDV